MLRYFNRFCKNTKGNIAIYFALALVPVTILIGGSIDLMRSNNIKQQLQYSLDAAVLAGAGSGVAKYQSEAKSYFSGNVATYLYVEPKAVFSTEKRAGSQVFVGNASAEVPTLFSSLLKLKKYQINVSSEATLGSPSSSVCIYIMDPLKNYALRVNSGANVVAPDCEIHVHSKAAWAANFNASIVMDFKRICIAGTGILDNLRTPLKNMETGCDAADDPYAGVIEEPKSASCDYNNLNLNGGAVTLKPGVYCGWMNFNGNPDVTFQPGLYRIRSGGWNVNGGNWKGDGVTFYFEDTSKIQFNSGVGAKLRPPVSGTYKDVLIFEKSGLRNSDFILDDSKNFDIEGIIHLPSRDTTYNSGSGVMSRKLTMVFNSLILNNTRWTLSPGDPDSAGSSVAGLRISH